MTDAAILGRQVELLYRNTPLGQAITCVNASLLAWLWQSSIGMATSGAWWLAAVGVAVARILLARAFRRRPDAGNPDGPLSWLRLARLGAAGGGMIWAAGAFLFMAGGNAVQEIFTAFVMAGMVAGAVPILAADRLAFRLYAWPIVVTTGLMALGKDPLHITFSLMAVMFLWGMTRSANLFNQALVESLRLEHEKGALVDKLERARQAAAGLTRAKAEFLANISHELLTPINRITGMAELMGMEEMTTTQRELLDPLRQSAGQLRLLIDNVIDLAALEAEQFEPHATPFTLADLLPGCLAQPRKMAEAKGLAFEYEADRHLPAVVVGDVDRLRRILVQLADNAVKFTDRGRIRVEARLQEKDAENVRIEFLVADTGIGIPDDKVHSIFERFTHLDGAARRHAGVGVGLPICRKLAELMQGSLTVESRPGAGSTFRLSLPFGLPAV